MPCDVLSELFRSCKPLTETLLLAVPSMLHGALQYHHVRGYTGYGDGTY